ncbi:MAG: phosphotransferase [Thermoplasmata archaeon]
MISNKELEIFINGELRKQRWFGQKLEKISVGIEDRIPAYTTENLGVEFFILKTKPGNKRYFVPIAFAKSAFQIFEAGASVHTLKKGNGNIHVFEAEYLDVFPSIIYRMFEDGERFAGKKSEISFVLRQNIRGLKVRKGEVIGGDTTNFNLKLLTSERTMVLKTYRTFDADNPEVEMLLQLSNFKNVPHVLGYAEVSIGGKVANGFLLMEFLECAGDGIKAFMKDLNFLLNSDRPEGKNAVMQHSEGLAAKLGKTTAEMHVHLIGEDEKFQPEIITEEDIERWKSRILSNLNYCLEKIQKLPAAHSHSTAIQKMAEEIEKEMVAKHLEEAGEFAGLQKIRTHQDYHLGQVLYGKEENFYVLDFEGEPGRKGAERREKLPPLRDVATMLRSFAYLKHLAFRNYLEERLSITGEREKLCWAPLVLTGIDVDLWIDEKVAEMLNLYEEKTGNAFVKNYIQKMRELNSSLVPEIELSKKMLKFWKIEKAIYELKYELEYRVEYAGIPIAGILEELRD